MSRVPPLPRLPNALLGLLTLVCFSGPLAMWLVVRGGSSGEWPPDRAVEWGVFGLVVVAAAALFVACVTIGWWYRWPGAAVGEPDRWMDREDIGVRGEG